MTQIETLRQLAQESIDELNAIGIHPNITPNEFSINTRKKKSWGTCWTHWDNSNRTKWHFTIEISSRLFVDGAEKGLRETVLHELIHACDECVGVHHGGKWAEYAELVNDCYGLNIKRCNSNADKGLAEDRNEYRCKCSKCGKMIVKKGYRAPKWYKHPQGYTHTCIDGTKNPIVSEYYHFKPIKAGALIYV